MKTLQNNFTTPEQSKRLLKLGVPADSADCYYIDSMTSFQDKSPHIIHPNYKYSDGIPNGYESRFCPCWSVGRLIEIIYLCKTHRGSSWDLFYTDFQLTNKLIDIIENYNFDFSKLEE